MDAVQKANSGHPGTPMALAPLAHVLFTRIMRYDAARRRLARPRPLRAVGRARVDAALLDAVPHRVRTRARRPQAVPPVGVAHARSPRARPRPRRRGHDRAPSDRASRNGVGIGDRRAAPARALRRRRVRPPRVRDLLRRRPRRGREPRGGVTGRPPRARTARLRLRRQPHLDRRPHRARVLRRRAVAASRVTTGTSSQLGEVAEDLDALEHGLREGIAVEDRPTLLILRSHIGYPSPKYTDTAHAHGNPLGDDEVAKVKEILGMPPEDFWVPDDVLDVLPPSRQRAAARSAKHGAKRVTDLKTRATQARPSEFDLMISAGAAATDGRRSFRPGTPARASPPARRVRRRSTAILDVVPGLIGGGADLTGNTGTELKGQAQIDARRLHRPPAALRRARARHGLDHERHGGVRRGAAVRRDVLHLQRLRTARRAPRCTSARQGRVRLVARLGRPRRGRPDTPADRAPHGDAGDAGAAPDPSRRRQRGPPGVARPHRRRRADRDHPHPPEPARARRHGRARARGAPRGRVHARRRDRRRAPISC